MSTDLITKVARRVSAIEQCVAIHERAVPKLVEQMDDALKRIARLELTVEALVGLQVRAGVPRSELQQMMERIDLSDGFEDGRMGHDETAYAHACDRCGLPVNPARAACLYCEAPLDPTLSERPLPERPVPCAKCGTPVTKSDSYFSAEGAICAKCHYGG